MRARRAAHTQRCRGILNQKTVADMAQDHRTRMPATRAHLLDRGLQLLGIWCHCVKSFVMTHRVSCTDFKVFEPNRGNASCPRFLFLNLGIQESYSFDLETSRTERSDDLAAESRSSRNRRSSTARGLFEHPDTRHASNGCCTPCVRAWVRMASRRPSSTAGEQPVAAYAQNDAVARVSLRTPAPHAKRGQQSRLRR